MNELATTTRDDGTFATALRGFGPAGTMSKVAIVLVVSASFALAHRSSQGLPGVEQAVFTGLVFGTIAMLTGSIVFVMIAHAAFDLFALALIYWNLEPAVAHLIFR